MKITLRLTEALAAELSAQARADVETAAVMLVGVAAHPDGNLDLLAREIHWMAEDSYVRREADALSVSSSGFVPPLRRAEELGAMALWVHTHPGGRPTPSKHDRLVDEQLEEVFPLRTGQAHYGSLIFSPGEGDDFSFTGHVFVNGEVAPVEQCWTTGSRFRLTSAYDSESPAPTPAVFDRQIRAFGSDIQAVLGRLRVGVVGAGGTGSAVIEQLARLGIKDLVVIDPDVVEESNLTRVYGSDRTSIGQPKAEVLAAHAMRVGRDLLAQAVVGRITDRSVATMLTDRDILFGCTDDNAGRIVLSRLASYYLTPVIDCGVLLSSTNGRLQGIDGRVTLLSPGYPCLICRGRIDLARAAAEQLNPEERRLRQDEGYAPELGRTEPSVVSYTSMVAALVVAEVLERLTGYGPVPAPSELLLRAHDREISTNRRPPQSGHFCDPANGKMGAGDQEPFLGTLWGSR